MKKNKESIVVLFVYIIVMFVICITSVNIITQSNNDDTEMHETVASDTEAVNADVEIETVYIPMYIEKETDKESETICQTELFSEMLVKSYEGKIGVFLNTGELIEVLDVYIKSLPITDRRLLEEGIVIRSKDELRAIIEDYTG